MARSTRYNIMCKVCQWLAAGRWFSQGTPVSSTNKTDRHDITEILLKVGLNTITLTPFCFVIVLCCFALMVFHLWIWLWWRGKFASPPNRYFSQITLTNRIYLYNIHLPNWKTTWNIFAWIWKENLTMIANLVQQNWSIWYCFFLFFLYCDRNEYLPSWHPCSTAQSRNTLSVNIFGTKLKPCTKVSQLGQFILFSTEIKTNQHLSCYYILRV
jgi:hypothetical protein